MSFTEKWIMVGGLIVKFSLLLGLLYFFVCSLSFLSDAFRLLGGQYRLELLQVYYLCNVYLHIPLLTNIEPLQLVISCST